MKSFILILALVAVSQATNIQGSILTFNSNGAMKSSPKAESYNFQDLISLYKHSMGLNQEKLEQTSQQFINNYQRGNIMNPSYMNYLIMFEGSSQEENRDLIVSKQKKIDFQIDEKQDQTLMEQIFNSKDKSSVAYGITHQYISNSPIPMYFFTLKGQQNKYFKNFGVSIKQNKDLKLSIFDVSNPLKKLNSFSIEQCLSSGLNNQYYYNKEQNVLGKINSDLKIDITEQNVHQVSQLLEEVCGAIKISHSFEKGDKPNFMAFHFSSIEEMRKVSNPLENAFVKEFWKQALTAIVSNFDNFFKNSVLGSVIFVDKIQFDNYILADSTLENLPKNIQFTQLNSKISQRRQLAGNEVVLNSNYQIRVWFSVFFIVLIYFTLYALFTAKSDRDSLLYAKFLTTDYKN